MRISTCKQNFNPGDEVTVKFHNGNRNKGTIIREVITAVSEICARWYVVQFNTGFQDTINARIIGINLFGIVNVDGHIKDVCDVKPYLFPLSSMTEEQTKEFLSVAEYEPREEDCGRHTETYYYDLVGHENEFFPNSEAIDWSNKNHFDCRGLINKGLAIDATGLNIY